MKRGWLALPLALASGAIVACASAAGPATGPITPRSVDPATPALGSDPTGIVTKMMIDWQRAITRGAESNPATRYPNPSRASLDAQLSVASSTYGFKVVSVTMLHPLQNAPVIVVQFPTWMSNEGSSFNQSALASILSTLKSETGSQLYEAFFLEALDDSTPFYARYSAGRADMSKSWTSRVLPSGSGCSQFHICSPPTTVIDLPLCGSKDHPSLTNTTAKPCTAS